MALQDPMVQVVKRENQALRDHQDLKDQEQCQVPVVNLGQLAL